mmetsp:Transcript_28266/g.79403  ORF Transcript_28266/g.79403 Transcript_28266/m.79403 type:complete len:289 (+) Transcript_28266:146-1012(+)
MTSSTSTSTSLPSAHSQPQTQRRMNRLPSPTSMLLPKALSLNNKGVSLLAKGNQDNAAAGCFSNALVLLNRVMQAEEKRASHDASSSNDDDGNDIKLKRIPLSGFSSNNGNNDDDDNDLHEYNDSFIYKKAIIIPFHVQNGSLLMCSTTKEALSIYSASIMMNFGLCYHRQFMQHQQPAYKKKARPMYNTVCQTLQSSNHIIAMRLRVVALNNMALLPLNDVQKNNNNCMALQELESLLMVSSSNKIFTEPSSSFRLSSGTIKRMIMNIAILSSLNNANVMYRTAAAA